MNYLGIAYTVRNLPALDRGFIPLGAWNQAYLASACRPAVIALEREDGLVTVYRTRLRDTSYDAANYRYLERLIKFLLWSAGGWRVYLSGGEELQARLRAAYSPDGVRRFDAGFVEEVYGRPLELVFCREAAIPAPRERPRAVGGHVNGCRIGFDAGGSDRKVSAVMDGRTVYTEEVVWHPKTESDPDYHLREIVTALRTAASKLPRVDGIGVSTAGVCVGPCPRVSSLFMSVPRHRRDEVQSIYCRAAAEIGDVPLAVANDGDVTALCGAMSLGCTGLLGIAMGTSQAAGYVDGSGCVAGWLNELAFAPVDLCEDAAADEWSTDAGVGCKYFSQDAVIKLAPAAGLVLDETLTPAEKLTQVQTLAASGDARAREVFRSIGVYLGHTAALYAAFYDMSCILLAGRAVSGIGGELMAAECVRVLREEYPALAQRLRVELPDEMTRRIGQSVAAASLPEIG